MRLRSGSYTVGFLMEVLQLVLNESGMYPGKKHQTLQELLLSQGSAS